MILDTDICYAALKSKDSRFDGRFFVGITSTGIYCRPVCPARSAKREHCQFFSSAAAAEKAGFRPCLRCRPELAPGNAPVDTTSQLVEAAVTQIDDTLLQDQSVSDIADVLGITGRHLRRIFRKAFGVTPIEYVQTKRLLLAKHLLTDTSLSITEIAFASGFSSLRRFHALFRERYRLTPSDIRRNGQSMRDEQAIKFELGYRPPLDWESLLGFLEPRMIPGVETITANRYMRTAQIHELTGWFAVKPVRKKPVLQAIVSPSLIPAIRTLMARVKRMFDLTANPPEIESHLQSIPIAHPGLRVPGTFNGLEMAVRAILGQQITVKAATTLAGRLTSEFGKSLETPHEKLKYLFPGPKVVARLTVDDIARLGIIATRSQSIITLAQMVTSGTLELHAGVNAEETISVLRSIPGVGDWTAQYIAMRALGWPDAFPHTDLAIKKALKEDNPTKILKTAEAWRPWRAYAAMHLWKSLEE